MAKTFIPYVPDTVEGQAILANVARTQRVLRYRDGDKLIERLQRGMPHYELEPLEQVGEISQNRLIRGECISACASLKAEGIKVDLVYIDPPFASGADYAKKVYLRRNPKLAAQLAEAETLLELDELRAFEEKMYGDIWNKEDYLNWMYENLMAIKIVMSESASIYVHLDWHIGHYVKILMDEVFGENNYRNEIIVNRVKKNIRERELVRTLNVATDSIYFFVKDDDVKILPPTKEEDRDERWHSFEAAGYRSGMDYDLFGFKPTTTNHWRWQESKAMNAIENFNQWISEFSEKETLTEYWKRTGEELLFIRSNPRTKKPEYFIPASDATLCDTVWDDISAYAFKNGYATEKSEDLLSRIIRMHPDKDIVVADFFGGGGVTAKVAHDLGRTFIHVDVGINSIQTTRDRLQAVGASFTVYDVKDGVSLFRNPIQTMDKLKSLITGLRNEDALDSFWEGSITDSKWGTIPVYLPNLLDHSTKVLDTPLMNRVINEAIPDLPDDTKKVIVYYVDVCDMAEVQTFIKDYGPAHIDIELRDLKALLDEIIINDEIDFSIEADAVRLNHFSSDRLNQKISDYNKKRALNGKPHPPLRISDDGLELIEYLSLDCTRDRGAWHSDSEIKIDKNGYVAHNGNKTKNLWNGIITFERPPKRMKLRNIAGDETIVNLMEQSPFHYP